MSLQPILSYRPFEKCALPSSFLFEKIAERESIGKTVLTVLPKFLHAHFSGCAIQGQTLVIFTDSPAWSSRVRFHSAEVLARFRKSGINRFESLVVRTRVAPRQKPASPLKNKLPSQEIAGLIRKNAMEINSPALSQSLLRLALTIEQRNIDRSMA